MTVLTPLVVVGLVAATALWVLIDARRCAREGAPVSFRAGSFALATPEAWAIACLLVFVIFVPIYAVARRS